MFRAIWTFSYLSFFSSFSTFPSFLLFLLFLLTGSALLAGSVIESRCPFMYIYLDMSPPDVTFFEASHWPSDHMISSRPLIYIPGNKLFFMGNQVISCHLGLALDGN